MQSVIHKKSGYVKLCFEEEETKSPVPGNYYAENYCNNLIISDYCAFPAHVETKCCEVIWKLNVGEDLSLTRMCGVLNLV